MRLDEYACYDALGLADLVRRGDVQPAELVELAFQAISATNARLNAIIDVYRDEAESTLSHGIPDGPFRGVPFLAKDLSVSYAGKPTTMGSRLFAHKVAPADTELVSRYRRAGLITVGRTNSPELGLSFVTEPLHYGPTRNPWQPEFSPGGSSGGSAAAVAARLVPVAHGNDAGGSLRVPAACCGIFGLKPTRGRIPAGPFVGEPIFGIAAEHVLTRSVRDSAAMLDITAGGDVGAPYAVASPERTFLSCTSTPPRRLRIAVMEQPWNEARVDPECVQAVAHAARLCSDMGHEVMTAQPQVVWSDFRAAYHGLVSTFVAQVLDVVAPRLGVQPSPDTVERSNLAIAARGRSMRAVDLANAMALRDQLARRVGHFFAHHDLLLSPTWARTGLRVGELDLNVPGLAGDEVLDRLFAVSPFTPLFNLTGNPAMSVPVHISAMGLPVGVQFVAPWGDEATLFQLAGQLEKALRWGERRPAVVVGSSDQGV